MGLNIIKFNIGPLWNISLVISMNTRLLVNSSYDYDLFLKGVC